MNNVKTLSVAASQEALSKQLLDELRGVCDKDVYGNICYSTLIGVLEMLKFEMMENSK